MVSALRIAVLLLGVGLLSAAVADEVAMEWKKPVGQSLFDEGKSLFEEKKYKDAYDKLKDARKQAKGRPTRVEVDRWIQGSQGGAELTELKKQVQLGNAAAAHKHAESKLRQYANTPIGEEYSRFVEELEKDLFYILENFDVASKRYSEKYGKTFVKGGEMVKQGNRSLRWEVDKKNHELKVKKIPADLPSYENGAVTFWLHFESSSRGGPYQLVFSVPGKSSSTSGSQIDNAFIKQMKPHTGWKKIEVPLKQFVAQGDVDWKRVRDFRIQFLGGRKFTCHVDYVALRK